MVNDHWQAIKDHGFMDIAPCDIMDEDVKMKYSLDGEKHLNEYDIVGNHIKNYDSMLILSHFKGHAKSGGQLLIVIAGTGWYKEEGKEARKLKVGDVVNIPANVKHWHGAAKDSWFQHIAQEIPGTETWTEWCEPVSEEEYNQLEG